MRKSGAGDGIRTRDIDLGKVALYQLSYSRANSSIILLQNILKVKRCEYVTDFKAIRNLWQSEAPVLDYSLG